MPPCNGDCNQGRECNCECKKETKMTTKDEALRMAIEAMNSAYSSHGKILTSNPAQDAWLYHGCDAKLFKALQACKEALEPTVAELNDEYLRDTHVEGLSTNSKANEIIKTQHWLCLDGQMVVAQLYTKPPSRKWQSLSDEEIWVDVPLEVEEVK